MNLYEVVNSVECDWGIIGFNVGSLGFEKEDVSVDGDKVIICDGNLDFSIPKTVKFELSEDDIHFLRFEIVGQTGFLSLHKKITWS